MSQITTITLNPSVDASCQVQQVIPVRKLRCTPLQHHPGGGGLNVARAIQQLGGSARALWTCGGVYGRLLHQLLDEEGLVHEPLEVAGSTRENFIAFEESSGHLFRFCLPGAELDATEAERLFGAIEVASSKTEYLILSGSLPPGLGEDFYGLLLPRLAQACKVIIDTRGPAVRPALAHGVFLAKPNLAELGELAGRDLSSDGDVQAAARELVEQGAAEAIVVSLGPDGALLATRDRTETIPAPKVKKRSAVGAGDSMVGAMVLSLSRGSTLQEAVRFGVAAGTAAVMTPGTELCRLEDVERVFAEMTSNTNVG